MVMLLALVGSQTVASVAADPGIVDAIFISQILYIVTTAEHSRYTDIDDQVVTRLW